MGADVTFKGVEWTDAKRRQRAKALALYGQDEPASAVPPRLVLPATSKAFALEIARWWHPAASHAMTAAIQASPDTQTLFLLTVEKQMITLARNSAEILRNGGVVADEDIAWIGRVAPMAAQLLRGVRAMYSAIALPVWPARTTADGRPIMSPYATRSFWDAQDAVALACYGSGAVYTASEGWNDFTDGARAALNAVADAAGRAAGAVAGAIGRAAGTGIGAFLDEVGIIPIAIGAGGLYVAWRFL